MDEYSQHIALPQLYGAPAYARPPVAVAHTPRPIDPDDLPIVADMTEDDIAVLAALPHPAGGVPGTVPTATLGSSQTPHEAASRPFSIRSIADRFLGPRP